MSTKVPRHNARLDRSIESLPLQWPSSGTFPDRVSNLRYVLNRYLGPCGFRVTAQPIRFPIGVDNPMADLADIGEELSRLNDDLIPKGWFLGVTSAGRFCALRVLTFDRLAKPLWLANLEDLPPDMFGAGAMGAQRANFIVVSEKKLEQATNDNVQALRRRLPPGAEDPSLQPLFIVKLRSTIRHFILKEEMVHAILDRRGGANLSIWTEKFLRDGIRHVLDINYRGEPWIAALIDEVVAELPRLFHPKPHKEWSQPEVAATNHMVPEAITALLHVLTAPTPEMLSQAVRILMNQRIDPQDRGHHAAGRRIAQQTLLKLIRGLPNVRNKMKADDLRTISAEALWDNIGSSNPLYAPPREEVQRRRQVRRLSPAA